MATKSELSTPSRCPARALSGYCPRGSHFSRRTPSLAESSPPAARSRACGRSGVETEILPPWQSVGHGYTRGAVPDETESSSPPPVEAEASEAAAPAPEQDPLEAAKAEQAKLKDQLLRTLADFDNFRKRSRRELSDAERRGRDDLLKEFLPVFDNLDRASAHAETATDIKALADGIALVMRQFADTLTKVGIERVPAVGKPFDPSLHEAVQQMETTEFEPGTIAAEVQAGYRNAEKLIRPALVVVAKAKSN
ncbi:MAG: nucleotide exchange factor GrpE [Myxococcales bacterium]|nr:MAG: nucleotide exchange factor GrpE [Myxococcales bacterium]